MPNENDNNDISDLSIDEINDLYSDILEFPEDVRLSSSTKPSLGARGQDMDLCAGGGGGK